LLEGCKIQPPMGVLAPGEKKSILYLTTLYVAQKRYVTWC